MSTAPFINRGQWGHLYGPEMLAALEEIFQFNYEQHLGIREMVFRDRPMSGSIMQTTESHDLPLFSQVPEGGKYTFAGNKQGAKKTYEPVKFGLGFSISEEAVSDGEFDKISELVAHLGRSGAESKEIAGMNIFNNGFTTETTADGVALFSTAHLLPSGGTWRNKLSTDSDLSATSLEQMLLDFEVEQVSDQGKKYKIMPEKLLVHPSNKRLASELLNSTLKPETVEAAGGSGITNINNMNSFKDEGLGWISSPHLTDDDGWFMLAPKDRTGLTIANRSGMETKAAGPDVGFVTDAILYKARYREDIGASHGYGVFGTSGS